MLGSDMIATEGSTSLQTLVDGAGAEDPPKQVTPPPR